MVLILEKKQRLGASRVGLNSIKYNYSVFIKLFNKAVDSEVSIDNLEIGGSYTIETVLITNLGVESVVKQVQYNLSKYEVKFKIIYPLYLFDS